MTEQVTVQESEPERRITFIKVAKKLRVECLSASSTGVKRLVFTAKPTKDGRLYHKKHQLDIPIDPNLLIDGGGTILVDMDRRIQIGYKGMEGWRGIDGAYSWRAEYRRIVQALALASVNDLLKWAKLAVVLTGITLAALVVSVIVLAGQLKA